MTLTVRGDRAAKRLRLTREARRCVFLYFYYVDRDFGLMHIRLQTWLPLPHHAIEHFTTGDLLRFLGRVVPGRFQGEAHTTLVHRPEGVRIRHWLDENSIKMYDKAGRLLRVEMTLE
jgi:hypothetical protein